MKPWQIALIVALVAVALVGGAIAYKRLTAPPAVVPPPPPPPAVDSRRRGTSAADAFTSILGAGAGALVGYLAESSQGKK